jgi:hypothetical protein
MTGSHAAGFIFHTATIWPFSKVRQYIVRCEDYFRAAAIDMVSGGCL